MSKFDRKIKRLQERRRKKNNGALHADGHLSFCSIHGPYTSDNLCGCYDKDGLMDGASHSERFSKATSRKPLSSGVFCPIHGGPFSRDELCSCFNEGGNLRSDWDKNSK